MGGIANVVIKIGASAGQAVSEIDKVNNALGDQMSAADKASSSIKKAAVPAAIAFTAVAAASIDAAKAAAEHQAEEELLAHQLGRVTDATDAQLDSVGAWITKLELATGVSHDQLEPALGKLATATGDLTSAQQELGIALDVSAQTGKSLDVVSTAIAKAHAGNFTALSRLIPGMDQAAIKSKNLTAALQELSDLSGGAAAEHASTAAGQFQIWQLRMDDLKISLGDALLPVMEKFLPIVNQMTDVVSQHTTAVTIAVGVIGALAGAILVANAALKAYEAIQVIVKVATVAWTGAQIALNVALDANPIGLIVIAIAALVAAIVVAYTHSQTFRNIVGAAFDAVKVAVDAVASAFTALYNAASSAFAWIVAHWQLGLLALGPIGAALLLIVDHFDAIKNAAAEAFGVISSSIDAAIDAVKSLIDWLGRVHVPHISIPNPFGVSVPTVSSAGLARGAAGAAPRASSAGVTVNVYGAVDPEGTARAIRRVLRNSDRRLGLAW